MKNFNSKVRSMSNNVLNRQLKERKCLRAKCAAGSKTNSFCVAATSDSAPATNSKNIKVSLPPTPSLPTTDYCHFQHLSYLPHLLERIHRPAQPSI